MDLSLSTSGLYEGEGESVDSDDVREVDTDTDGLEELTLEEATQNMRKLQIMRDNSPEFLALLHMTLVQVPVQCKFCLLELGPCFVFFSFVLFQTWMQTYLW
jgi:hypothetical protein